MSIPMEDGGEDLGGFEDWEGQDGDQDGDDLGQEPPEPQVPPEPQARRAQALRRASPRQAWALRASQ